jgi:hypothetical protein
MFDGMRTMFMEMLKDAIPPEVQEMLTPDKMQELGEKVTVFVTDVRERLDRIEAKANHIHDVVDKILLRQENDREWLKSILEKVEADDTSNSGKRARKPRAKSDSGSAVSND